MKSVEDFEGEVRKLLNKPIAHQLLALHFSVEAANSLKNMELHMASHQCHSGDGYCMFLYEMEIEHANKIAAFSNIVREMDYK